MGEDYPSLLRSEEMSLCHFYIPQEVAHATVEELASIGNVVEFNDLDPDVNPFQRHHVTALRRLDELTRRLNFLTTHTHSLAIPLAPSGPLPDHLTASQQVDALDPHLVQLESRVSAMNSSYETLEKRMSELVEAREVLRECEGSFQSSQRPGFADEVRQSFEDDSRPLLQGDADLEQGLSRSDGLGWQEMDIEFITGTVPRKLLATFERVLWRVLRGNLYMNHIEIKEPLREINSSGEVQHVYKNVFIIFAHGDELLAKIRKIAQSLGCTLYPTPKTPSERRKALQEIHSRIDDLSIVLSTTSQTRKTELERVAESLNTWWTLIRRERLVYETMNRWRWGQGRRTLLAEGWVPTRDVPKVQGALRNASEEGGVSASHPTAILHVLSHSPNPPTFHRTNKFTEGFQSLVDSYGIATYQEFNPGIITIVTFPFLFAVMFGDIAHGLLILLSAVPMIIMERRLKNVNDEIFQMFFYGRYILLLMGAFSIYSGFMYNDIASMSLSIWKSGWNMERISENVMQGIQEDHIYPFGLDPAWHGADNYLLFTNSLKMKMSVILGVIHMSFALFLQIPNHLRFKHGYAVWAEFLPQFLFMECLFGYLIVAIVYKWTIDWSQSTTGPPNLLNMLIYMFLSPGTVDPETKLYPGQNIVQIILLLVAVVCVPWMLCAKPYVIYKQKQRIKGQGYSSLGAMNARRSDITDEDHHEDDHDRGEVEGDEDGQGHSHETHDDEAHDDEEEMGDVIINQVIHTIEYCLGCISNTASYLRLWALSLAHAQLSEVLWSMTLGPALSGKGAGGVAFLVVVFAIWFTLTIAILCLMEGLSAFLHALRLHWVEANNKHYLGGGRQYTPVTFEGLDGVPTEGT